MRLFISYARVDKPYCQQIVKTLDVHDVWYDQRLHAGQKWWDEILRRLAWCEGFVYLLSPDSVKSEYCQKEFDIAQRLGKVIFPVVIQSRTMLPDTLGDYQYIDLSEGLTTESVKSLLNAIYVGERENGHSHSANIESLTQTITTTQPAVSVDPMMLIDQAADALDLGEFDRAVFLLKQAMANGQDANFRFIDVRAMLRDAEDGLQRQTYLREAEREYEPIAALMRRERTRKLGCDAFAAFREFFPDYDPEDLSRFLTNERVSVPVVHISEPQRVRETILDAMPLMEWCEISGGTVMLDHDNVQVEGQVEPFMMSKYPITNAQFQFFLNAPDGYGDPSWWDFSPHGYEWRSTRAQLPYNGVWPEDYPRVLVNWYEAIAFCRWLSHQTGLDIMLPNEMQWQRAAEGDDRYAYPWGDDFDAARCNARESLIRQPTSVLNYPNGASPYGVWDMAGNTWEWCIDSDEADRPLELVSQHKRVVRGGSFFSVQNRLRNTFAFYLNPLVQFDTIGFRLVYPLR